MNTEELIVAELDALRARKHQTALTILETGSIRSDGDEYRTNDGWSTLAFAQQAATHGGHLYSIDLDTTAATAVLERHQLHGHVSLLNGHSIDVLAGMLHAQRHPELDVAYLDSDNDAGLILHEYLLVTRLLRPPALVLVDDVDPGDAHVVKGHQLLPWLQAHHTLHRTRRRTGTSYSTGVLVIEE